MNSASSATWSYIVRKPSVFPRHPIHTSVRTLSHVGIVLFIFNQSRKFMHSRTRSEHPRWWRMQGSGDGRSSSPKVFLGTKTFPSLDITVRAMTEGTCGATLTPFSKKSTDVTFCYTMLSAVRDNIIHAEKETVEVS